MTPHVLFCCPAVIPYHIYNSTHTQICNIHVQCIFTPILLYLLVDTFTYNLGMMYITIFSISIIL